MQMGSKERVRWATLLILGVLCLAGALILYNLNQAAIQRELIALDLLPKPETFTELYFEDSAHLPASALDRQPVTFTFVIHNLEATDFQYRYQVSLVTDSRTTLLDGGQVLLKNKSYWLRPEHFQFRSSSRRQEIVVSLLNIQQSIHFWMGGQ